MKRYAPAAMAAFWLVACVALFYWIGARSVEYSGRWDVVIPIIGAAIVPAFQLWIMFWREVQEEQARRLFLSRSEALTDFDWEKLSRKEKRAWVAEHAQERSFQRIHKEWMRHRATKP